MSSGRTTKSQNTGASYFSQPDGRRQLGLEVEEQIFWVSKEYLSIHSPVFNAMLYGNFDEAGKNIIALPQKKAKDVMELLLCLFPTPVTRKINHRNVGLLLAFADEYQMDDLTSRCCGFFDMELQKLPDGDPKLLTVLKLASKYRLRPIVIRAVERCAKCFGMEKLKSIFDQLPSEVIGAIAWTKLTPKHEVFVTTQPTSVCRHCFSANMPIVIIERCGECGKDISTSKSSGANLCTKFDWRRCGLEKLLKRV